MKTKAFMYTNKNIIFKYISMKQKKPLTQKCKTGTRRRYLNTYE